MKKVIMALLILQTTKGLAQTDSTQSPLTFSGYIEAYYLYDFGNPADHNRPGFVYSFNRHNEINLNLGYVKTAYQTNNVRANLALAVGSYMNANLAAEPGVLKNIFEANIGVKISKKKNLWINAGIFASHIGFESAVGASCWNLTRSILADNSPYYESGAKISYTSNNGKWFLSGLLLNGWQRIQRATGNQTLAFGHQLTWTPNKKITLNSSSFIGNDMPDSTRKTRYFHNFYGQFQFHQTFGLIVGFDIGAEQKAKGSSIYNIWYSPVLIARYTPTEKLALAVRAEYYSDVHGVIIATGTPNGFQTFAYSANVHIRITENVLLRVEAGTFNSKNDNIFLDRKGSGTKNNYVAVTSLSVSF